MRRLDYQGPHPIWRIMLMTEMFGPAGTGWGYEQTEVDISTEMASVCGRVWWKDATSGERRLGPACRWESSTRNPDLMSVSVEKAINLSISVAEPNFPSRIIPLSKGYAAIVDAEDYVDLSVYLWSVDERPGRCCAVRGEGPAGKQRMIQMHRQIMGAKDKEYVDHVNRNALDNRRKNLRLCTNKENTRNSKPRQGTSEFKGVCRSRGNNWSAQIHCDGKKKHLGTFGDEHSAAKAYDDAAREMFGEFAYLNFGGNP